MKRRLVTSLVGLVLLAAVFASPAAAAAPAGSGRVNVSVVPRSKVVFSVVDQDHIDLRANAPWRLTLLTSAGAQTVYGGLTGNTPVRLTIPSDTVAWWVDLEPEQAITH
jgi:hypothetical protein